MNLAGTGICKTVKSQKMKQKRIAIDLRTPEEMAAELEDQETEA